MGTIIIILIIGFIIYALANKKEQPQTQKTYTRRDYSPNKVKETRYDRSVIDVTRETDRFISPNDLKKYSPGVPFWAHHYVYSNSEIYSADAAQRQFYQFNKLNFLNGIFFDLEGNTNYAFILLFDLLNEFEYHKDTTKLEKQLKDLGQNYPKTKSYCTSFLIKKMDAIGDSEGAIRIRTQDRYENQNNYDYDYWRTGSKYKSKLNLTDDQVKLLNKLYYPGNNFCNIEFCYIEILKLYLAVFSELKKIYEKEETTVELQFNFVADIILRRFYKVRKGNQNYKYHLDSTINQVYSNIFKYCENALREYYQHKRKLSLDTYWTDPEIKIEYETRIISKVKTVLPNLLAFVAMPNDETDIMLNTLSTSRWKTRYDEIVSKNDISPKQFIENILLLGKANKNNPSVEIIFFEASKYISKFDKESALKLYVYYLYYDLNSTTFDNRQLTKTIQKSLFKTNDQLHEFEIIVSDLIKTKDLEKSIEAVSRVYAIKRKKIKLDKASIKEVDQKDAGAVKILNEYLKDEYEDNNRTIKSQEINNDEVKIEIYDKTDAHPYIIYSDDVKLTPIQMETIELFLKNSHSVSILDFDAFARAKGILKNQLVESINDTCFEKVDDILIEEEDDFYVINEQYYQRLLKND